MAVDAFNTLKVKLVKPLVLELPQPYRPYIVNTESPEYALGAVRI